MNLTIQVDELTIIIGSVILLLALITPMMSPFFRLRLKKKESDDNDDNSSLPPISVIITVHGNGKSLEDNLPSYLSQDYPADFQIIVVHEKGDSETDDIVKRYADDKHFYATFIPDSSRYMSKMKLAVTIGVKAAKYERIILTDATCRPSNDKWLRRMGVACRNNPSMVFGLTKFAAETKRYYIYEHTRLSYYILREALHGRAFRTVSRNIAFRKSDFIKGEGFRGNLQYLREEYNFLIAKLAERNNIATTTDPESWLIEEAPSRKTWTNAHMSYLNAKKKLKHSWRFSFLHRTDTLAVHIIFIAILAAICFAAFTSRWILLAAAVVAWGLNILIRALIANKAFRFFDIKMPPLKAVIYEKGVFWHNISNKFCYIRTNKGEFTSHKL